MQRKAFELINNNERPALITHDLENMKDRAGLQKLNHLQNIKHIRQWNKKILLLLVLFLLAGGVWRVFIYYQHQLLINQIPYSTRQSVDFPIYLPYHSHLNVSPDSISYSAGSLIFTIGDNDSKFIITEQAKPASFDINKFMGITETTPIVSNLGSGIRGKVANRTIVILATDKTLVTLVVMSNISIDKINSAITSLVKIE